MDELNVRLWPESEVSQRFIYEAEEEGKWRKETMKRHILLLCHGSLCHPVKMGLLWNGLAAHGKPLCWFSHAFDSRNPARRPKSYLEEGGGEERGSRCR